MTKCSPAHAASTSRIMKRSSMRASSGSAFHASRCAQDRRRCCRSPSLKAKHGWLLGRCVGPATETCTSRFILALWNRCRSFAGSRRGDLTLQGPGSDAVGGRHRPTAMGSSGTSASGPGSVVLFCAAASRLRTFPTVVELTVIPSWLSRK